MRLIPETLVRGVFPARRCQLPCRLRRVACRNPPVKGPHRSARQTPPRLRNPRIRCRLLLRPEHRPLRPHSHPRSRRSRTSRQSRRPCRRCSTRTRRLRRTRRRSPRLRTTQRRRGSRIRRTRRRERLRTRFSEACSQSVYDRACCVVVGKGTSEDINSIIRRVGVQAYSSPAIPRESCWIVVPTAGSRLVRPANNPKTWLALAFPWAKRRARNGQGARRNGRSRR
jgi:hypothetical protein